MREIMSKIMRRLGYVEYNDLKEELYQAAMESYRRNRRIRIASKYYTYEITVIDVWRKFLD